MLDRMAAAGRERSEVFRRSPDCGVRGREGGREPALAGVRRGEREREREREREAEREKKRDETDTH
jgi:hypothetical protein